MKKVVKGFKVNNVTSKRDSENGTQGIKVMIISDDVDRIMSGNAIC